MRAYDVIAKKRDGKALNEDEIRFLIHGYSRGDIPDYQISAWLMAAFLNGLNEDETLYLTQAMLSSGRTLELGSVGKPKVDKHSTGGVGDKISLILAPAAAACGVAVPMTSGRGLGFTGGTLDKLESIPGFRVNLREEEIIANLERVGFAMTGQTEDIAPADKKLYALRDVTATVESIPLITSSIMSKKLAEGVDGIVLDVKFGSGAFMKSKERALHLAEAMSSVAARMGKKAVCVLTSMEQPLGRHIGNSLEVAESIDCLHGRGEADILELTRVLGGRMLDIAGLARDPDEGEELISEAIRSGEAYERFRASVEAQGGDPAVVDDPSLLPTAARSLDVPSPRGGFVAGIDAEALGTAALFLGAGRFTKEDSIDRSSGMTVRKKIGDFVDEGEPLVTLHYNNERNLSQALDLAARAYVLSRSKPPPFRLVHEMIQQG
jgi:pyrimidine-nucleoside phosphorylase